MATSYREARRKRILERGSDRLALITGRIDTLSSPSSTEPHHSYTVSSPDLIYQDRGSQPDVSPQSNAASQDEDVSYTELPRREIRSASIPTSATNKLEPQLRKCETHVDATRTPDLNISSKVQSALVPPTARGPSNSAIGKPASQRGARTHRQQFFTASKISFSISASEKTRILSSITIALLVVLSHLRIPILSSNIIATIITTRPVYLVLLTDVTILLARLLREKQAICEKTEEIVQSEDAMSWAAGLGTFLEIGLVLYKATTAAFVDCSVYLLVVICGLSLLQGWL